MDETRRSLILGVSALPLVGLSACGGGNDESQTASSNGRAQAQGYVSSGNTTLTVAPLQTNGDVDLLFADGTNSTPNNGGRFITPDTSKVMACLNGTMMFVCISENVAGYSRTVYLQLQNFNTNTGIGTIYAVGNKLAFGNLFVNGDSGTHGDWGVQPVGDITVSVISNPTSTANGVMTLTFNKLKVDVVTDDKKILAGTNKAKLPMLLQGAITLQFTQENYSMA